MSTKIVFLGDTMLGENLYHFGRGIRTKFSNRYQDLIDNTSLQNNFSKLDYIFYNFEYSLVPKNFDYSQIPESVYRANNDSLHLFPEQTKKIVNIANNHFSQHGVQSAQYTKRVLIENNFFLVGENNKCLEITHDDKVIKIWGVSLVKDKNYCQEYFLSSYKNLLDDLKLISKKKNELWIISLHWGDEYIKTRSDEQARLAHKLIDSGFDLIIGHHPHVTQEIEKYKGKMIFYSLGNFIFDQNFSFSTQEGLVINAYLNSGEEYQIYKSNQKKYRINKFKEISFCNKLSSTKSPKNYKIRTKILSYLMSILMKLEFIAHIYEINRRVFFILLGRFKKKIKS